MPKTPATLEQVAAATSEISERVDALAEQLGYTGDLTVAGLLEGARHYMRRTVDDCLSLGACLSLLREQTDHGRWLAILGQLGIHQRTAQRFILAAVKTSKCDKMSHLIVHHAKTQAHMLELLVLDDDQAETLLDGGSIGDLTLDDIDTAPASELRRRLRAALDDGAAKDRVLADKSQAIDRAQTEIAKLKTQRDQGSMLVQVAVADPDEQRGQLLAELLRRTAGIETRILGDLSIAIAAVEEHAEATDTPADDAIAGAIAQIRRAVEELTYRHGVKAAPDGELVPSAGIWDAVNAELDAEDAQIIEPAADDPADAAATRLDS